MLNRFFSRTLLALSLGVTALAPLAVQAQGSNPAAQSAANASTWERVRSTKVIRVGVAVQDPFVYKDLGSGDWKGIVPQFAERIGKALGAKIEYVELSWQGAVAAIQNNQIDLFVGLDGTPERAASIDFVNVPMYRYAFAFYGSEKVNATSWATLNNPAHTIGVVLGQNFDAITTERAPKAKIKRFPSQADMLAAYQSNQLDGMVMTSPSAILGRTKIGKGKVTIIKDPETWLPILASIPPQADQRWRNFLTTSLTYLADTNLTLITVANEYAARGADREGLMQYFSK